MHVLFLEDHQRVPSSQRRYIAGSISAAEVPAINASVRLVRSKPGNMTHSRNDASYGFVVFLRLSCVV